MRLREESQELEAQVNKQVMMIAEYIAQKVRLDEDTQVSFVACKDENLSDEPQKNLYIITEQAFNQIIAESKLQKEELRKIYDKYAEEIANAVLSIDPERILKSGDRTIVFWADGTKTIVKRCVDEPDSEYTAYTAALAKKIYGSNSQIRKMLKDVTEYQKPKIKEKNVEE